MADFLQPELTSIALCWRLERRDGVTLGFTTHDRDLLAGGLVYRAAPGMLPSAIALSDGFDPDTLDVAGALTSAAISAADLGAGRWDGAAVAIFMVDWTAPEGATVPIARGTLGEISVSGEGFEAELRGPTAALDAPVVEQTSPECRAALGDRRCRVDLAGRVQIARVTAAAEARVEVAARVGDEARYGRMRWVTGANSGLATMILAAEAAAGGGTLLRLREEPAFVGAAGDLVEISEGCDRSFATCTTRFGNGVNFRGEPHLPGMDLLTRYPGA